MSIPQVSMKCAFEENFHRALTCAPRCAKEVSAPQAGAFSRDGVLEKELKVHTQVHFGRLERHQEKHQGVFR